MYPPETIDKLNALSKLVFGSSSRWRKLVEKGSQKLLTEDLEEVVPGENGEPDTVRKVPVPVRRPDGAYQYTLERHTLESVESYMLDLHKRKTEAIQFLKKAMEEREANQKKAELTAKVDEALTGSAVQGTL